MKMRLIKLNPKALTDALQGKAAAFALDLPADLELLGIKLDLFSNQVLAVVRSDSFEDLPEAYPIPELTTGQTAAAKEEAKPAPKSEAPPKATVKPVEKAPVQASQGTHGMEEEFTPEQQKLLSFKVEGDCVVVKPTQFLKAEWNDINDVVKSLGGRWVKGDIISYWEIPLQQN
jgi:hypothetical protein